MSACRTDTGRYLVMEMVPTATSRDDGTNVNTELESSVPHVRLSYVGL